MIKRKIEPELERITGAHKQLSSAVMAEINARGTLYSSFTIQERIARTATFCNEKFTALAKSFNTKKDQSEINLCFDRIIEDERTSLKNFCKSMKSISCNDGAFETFIVVKEHINNTIIQERKNRLIGIITLVVAIFTLFVSIVPVIQWFIPNPYTTTNQKETQNE